MIPDLAVIVSAYAGARLLCEYVFTGDELKSLRLGIAVAALALIAFFTLAIVQASSDLSL